MRIVFFLGSLLALAVAGYLAIGGYFLARGVTSLLDVGRIGDTIATSEPPTDPLAVGFRGDPLTALDLPYQTVAIETALGPAEAWFVPASGTETGRAIYVHGIAGAREDGYRHLSMLHQAGWSVLLISYRNDATAPAAAEGRYGFGLLEWPDLEAAVAHLAPTDADAVLVVAESMGGAILGQFLANSPLAARVKAVALDSPGLSFPAVLDNLAAQSGRPLSGVVSWIALRILPGQTGLPLAQAEVSDSFARFPGPLFVAHGTGDSLVPIGPSQALAAARPDTTVSLWTGADHLGSYAEDPDAYRAAFQDFLSRVP